MIMIAAADRDITGDYRVWYTPGRVSVSVSSRAGRPYLGVHGPGTAEVVIREPWARPAGLAATAGDMPLPVFADFIEENSETPVPTELLAALRAG